MSSAPFSLQIGSSTINRLTSNVILNRLHRSLDEYDVLEFSEIAFIPGSWVEGSLVQLFDASNNRRFSGMITSKHYGFDQAIGWQIGYTCFGLKYQGNTVAVTSSFDDSGSVTWNLPPTDPNYIQSNAGLSAGTILSNMFTMMATELAAVGIDSFQSADLTPLSLVPTSPITFQGRAFFDAIDNFLSNWYPEYACYIDPNGPLNSNNQPTGVIRVVNANAFTPQTMTLGVDPVDPTTLRLAIDVSQCYTRVVYRGKAWVGAAYLSTSDGTLTPAWTSTEQTDWNWSDFVAPVGAVDSGTVTGLTSTSVTCQSSSSTETWSVNQWSTAEAWIYLINPVATGLTFTEYRPVTANAAMAAGGTASVDWSTSTPLENSGYTLYHIIGQPSGSESDVWRRYNITNSYIAQHLMPLFPQGVPWGAQGSITLTYAPVASVCWAEDGSPADYEFPAQFEIDQETGQIRFYEPVVKYFNLQSNLDTGGASVTAPADVKIVIPYSRGALQAVAPGDTGGSVVSLTLTSGGSGFTSDPQVTIWGNGSGATATATVTSGVVTALTLTTGGSEYSDDPLVEITGGGGSGAAATATVSPIVPVYGGLGFSLAGIARTYYIDDETWIDPRFGSSYQTIAQNHYNVLCNPIVEGEIDFLGIPSAWDPLTLGYALNITGSGFTTGWESINACVREFDLVWPPQGARNHIMTFRLSNRRRLASGDSFYVHPNFAGKTAWIDQGPLPFEGTFLSPAHGDDAGRGSQSSRRDEALASEFNPIRQDEREENQNNVAEFDAEREHADQFDRRKQEKEIEDQNE